MNITVLNYLDHELVNSVARQASLRAKAASQQTEGDDFAASLNASSQALSVDGSSSSPAKAAASPTDSIVSSPEDYETYFQEASNTYGVSAAILKSIARAESNFNPTAVSSAGAVGIMQLMPSTAAALGVSNAYDVRENILGGAKYIGQLLSKYQGNISLALAAYNAGSGNVDKYGGIPPFAETQNYVRKVLSYMDESFPADNSSHSSGIFGLTGEERDTANEMLGQFFSANHITKPALDLLAAALQLKESHDKSTDASDSSAPNTKPGDASDSPAPEAEETVIADILS